MAEQQALFSQEIALDIPLEEGYVSQIDQALQRLDEYGPDVLGGLLVAAIHPRLRPPQIDVSVEASINGARAAIVQARKRPDIFPYETGLLSRHARIG